MLTQRTADTSLPHSNSPLVEGAQSATPEPQLDPRRWPWRGMEASYEKVALVTAASVGHKPYRLGRGTTAKVNLGLCLHPPQLVAIKRYSRLGITYAVECAALGSIVSLHVPRLIQHGYVSGRPFLVMEYIAGLPLRRAPAVAVTCTTVLGVLQALEDAHNAGFAHNDVNAHNILVTPNGRGMLIDFGWASPVSPEKRRRDLCCALEAFRGQDTLHLEPCKRWLLAQPSAPATDALMARLSAAPPPKASAQQSASVSRRPPHTP